VFLPSVGDALASLRGLHLAPFSTRPEKPDFSTKNQGFQVATIARNPVLGAGARSEFTQVISNILFV